MAWICLQFFYVTILFNFVYIFYVFLFFQILFSLFYFLLLIFICFVSFYHDVSDVMSGVGLFANLKFNLEK